MARNWREAVRELERKFAQYIGPHSLSQTLGVGNTTSGQNVSISAGDSLEFIGSNNNIFIKLESDKLIINDFSWPNSDGGDGYSLVTDGNGNLSFAPGGLGGETLSQTLAIGSSTSGQNITVTNGDYIEFPGAEPAAGSGTLRIAQGFTIIGRDDDNLNNRTLFSWSSDVLAIGHSSHDLFLNNYRWPQSDGLDGYVIKTHGNNTLSFVPVSSVFTFPRLQLTSTTHTFDFAHRNYTVAFTNSSAVTATVPANSTVAFPLGTILRFYQEGTGQVTVAAAGGVTIRSAETLLLRKQYSGGELTKINTDEWLLTGDLQLT